MLKVLVAVATALLMTAGVITVFSQGSRSHSSSLGVPTDLSSSMCDQNEMEIKGYYSGYYLKPGTTSGSGVSYTDSSNVPYWTIMQDSTNSSQWVIKTSSGMYLSLASHSASYLNTYSALEVISTASPDRYTKFVLSDASGSYTLSGACESHRYYIEPVAFPGYYMQGGTYKPKFARKTDLQWWLLQSAADLEFVIESSISGHGVCGVHNTGCEPSGPVCKTGISVPWPSSHASTSDAERIETQAQTMCNQHCMTCHSWDYYCKSCGGTIDQINTAEQGANTRRCDCNSAFKAVQMSLGSVLMLLAVVAHLR